MSIKTKPVMLLKTDDRDQQWAETFAEIFPALEIRIWPNVGNPADINCALLWAPPPELFSDLKNLEVLFSIGAGVDSLLTCPTLPADIPVVRMVEPQLTAGMVEYCLFNVLRFHRLMHRFEEQQSRRHWEDLAQVPASEITVGVMGLGVLGQALSAQLCALNYRVVGYRRSQQDVEGVEVFYGEDGLQPFLSRSMILVLLMPATAGTEKLINANTLAMLPPDAFLINAGRGDLVDENALVAALDNHTLEAAALDVFETEPLPESSPIWNHPRILVTPHIGSVTFPPTACRYIADAIVGFQQGVPWPNTVKTESGY